MTNGQAICDFLWGSHGCDLAAGHAGSVHRCGEADLDGPCCEYDESADSGHRVRHFSTDLAKRHDIVQVSTLLRDVNEQAVKIRRDADLIDELRRQVQVMGRSLDVIGRMRKHVLTMKAPDAVQILADALLEQSARAMPHAIGGLQSRWAPQLLIADCAAKRRIIEDMPACPECGRGQRCVLHDASAGDPTWRFLRPEDRHVARLLAQKYAHLNGYREEWSG